MDPITLAVVFLFAGAAILLGESDNEGLFGNRALGGGGDNRGESRSHAVTVHRTRSVKPAEKPEPKPQSFAERMKAAKEAKKNGRKVSSANNRDDSGNHLPSKSARTGTSGNEPAVKADPEPKPGEK